MPEIFVLMHSAWKSILKQKNIFLFSALPVVSQIFQIFEVGPNSNFLLASIEILISLFVWLASIIGVPYLAYRFSIDKPATIHETLTAIKIFSGRVFRFSCLSLLIFLPCLFTVGSLSMRNSSFPANFSTNVFLAFLPLSLFTSIWHFSIAGFFANDLGILKSIKEAWRLFVSHFRVLATTGVILSMAFTIINAAVGVLAVLVESRFDVTSLNGHNYINPYATLGNNVLFFVTNGILQIIWIPFSVSIFILAFVEYGKIKAGDHITSTT